MSIRTTLTKALARTAVPWELGNGNGYEPEEAKSIPITPTPFWPSSVWNSPLGVMDTGGALNADTAYAASALAYLCIRRRYEILSQAKPMVVEESDDGFEWFEEGEHPMAGLLKHPNADFSMERMLALTSVYRDVWGAALWLKIQDRGKRPRALYVFGNHEFKVESTDERLFGLFRIQTKKGEIQAKPEEVVFFAGMDPTDPLGAISPLDVALRIIGIGEDLRLASKAALTNAMAPSGVLSLPGELGPKEFEELQGRLMQQHTGMKRGNPLLLYGGASWQQISMTLQEIMPSDLIAWIEATVCAVFGLHPSMLGIKTGIENSPWSNLPTANKMLYDNMALPRWSSDADILTDQLLRDEDFNPDHSIRFWTDEIPALQDDVAANVAIAEKGLGFMTVNEKRAWMGYDPLPSPLGETVFISAQMVPAEMLVNGGLDMSKPLNGGNGAPRDDEEDEEEAPVPATANEEE